MADQPQSREDHRIELPNGRIIGFAEYGAPDGEPVFFFHGWPSSRIQGRLFDVPAKERGLRIIAVDRPGIGCSTFVTNRKLLDWPPVLVSLADALGIGRFSVLGVSGGAPYVLASAHEIVDRLKAAGYVCGGSSAATV